MCCYVECENGFEDLLMKFSFEEFLLIFLSVLMEKNIIFVSEKNSNLSKALAVFVNVIKPFKWLFPIIYNLPEDCIMMISSPIPVLIGINTNSSYVLEEIIPKTGAVINNDSLYVFLDEELIHFNPNTIKELPIPEYDNFYSKFKNLYKKSFSSKTSKYIKMVTQKQNKSLGRVFKGKNFDALRE